MAATGYRGWLERGRRYQREGRAIDAMLCFRQAHRVNPGASDAPFHLGEVLWQLGRITGAIAAWRDAVALNADHLAPNLALAEASLAAGNAPEAHLAAQAALKLAPQNARASAVAGVARLVVGDPEGSVRAVTELLERKPQLLEVTAIAAPFAQVLDRDPTVDGCGEYLAALMRSPEVLVRVSPLLLALVVEAAVLDPDRVGDRAALVTVARDRDYAPGDHVALGRIAAGVARLDAVAGRALGAHHAALCVAAFAPPTPLVWPVRSSGRCTRVLVLLPAVFDGDAARTALAAIANLPHDAFDVSVATVGHGAADVIAAVNAIAPTLAVLAVTPDTVAAKALAARDFDVLVDLAGTPAAPLLAQRPAREILTLGALPDSNVAPIVDRTLPDTAALVAALHGVHAGRDPGRDCPLDAAALEALWNDAVLAHQRGDRGAARAAYTRLLGLQPGFSPALYLRGMAAREEGERDAARDDFAAAIAAAPGNVDARVAAARAAAEADRPAAAIALCEDGLTRSPGSAALWRALGLAQLSVHEGAAAASAFARALALDPDDGDTHYNHGVALQMCHRDVDAARAYQRALAFKPSLVDADYNLGVLFQQQGRLDAAITAYETVLQANSKHVDAYKSLGETLAQAGKFDAWIANFGRFEANCPSALPLAVQALEVCHGLGDFPKVERYLDGLRQEAFRVDSESQLADCLEALLDLLLFFDVEPEMILRFAQTYDVAARRVYGEPFPAKPERWPGRVRIGYLSADLRNRAMGRMIWQALAHHDRTRFELFFYSLSTEDDEWTERYRGIADGFEVIASLAEREAAIRIAADDLDILVDLAAHTNGAKPGILAFKPARVQITHVASAGTVGLSAVDYKLTDRIADVPECRDFQIEAPLVMDGCVYPYRHVAPAATHPFHRAALGIAEEAVVVGVFVSGLKLARRCLSLWREVLERVPRAVLAFSPPDPGARRLCLRVIRAAGIPASRALFLPRGRDDAENQARYAIVDFVLDTMPCGEAIGAMEALDAGVPVVTLAGRRHGERMAYSILANLGVTETVAASGRDYVDIAVRLADDPAFMASVRAAIRERIAASPLTDMARHARNLEAAYVAALQERCPDALAAAQSVDV